MPKVTLLISCRVGSLNPGSLAQKCILLASAPFNRYSRELPVKWGGEMALKICHIISKVARKSYCCNFPSQIISIRLFCRRRKEISSIVQAAPGPGKADRKWLRWPKAVTGD